LVSQERRHVSLKPHRYCTAHGVQAVDIPPNTAITRVLVLKNCMLKKDAFQGIVWAQKTGGIDIGMNRTVSTSHTIANVLGQFKGPDRTGILL
jgi:hypothetical protein